MSAARVILGPWGRASEKIPGVPGEVFFQESKNGIGGTGLGEDGGGVGVRRREETEESSSHKYACLGSVCFKWNVNAHTQGIPEVVCEHPPKGWRGSNAHLEFSLETHAQLTKMKAYLRNIELVPKQLASWFILICWVVELG